MTVLKKLPIVSAVFRKVWLQIAVLLVILIGNILLDLMPAQKEDIHGYTLYKRWAAFLGIFAVTWILVRVVSVLRASSVMGSRLAPNISALLFTSLRILIFVLGSLIALDSIGISITPLLASLGVGSIAVGLALQDTLSNLFSGFYLYVDRPIAAGDWVRLENGMEGQVGRIGWRSTHLLSSENTVIIPNSKLSNSSVLNFNLPFPTASFNLVFSVSYQADLDRVEDTVRAAAESALRDKSDLSAGTAPIIRFTKFNETSVELTLILKARSFPDQSELRHEVIKRIRKAFRQEENLGLDPQRIFRLVSNQSDLV
ncbi:MAG: mechanosensitive ion channel family protein [Cryobacterium sp.]|nr:mechanosensitive ion channel family protein [Oligoflexia bacterium]